MKPDPSGFLSTNRTYTLLVLPEERIMSQLGFVIVNKPFLRHGAMVDSYLVETTKGERFPPNDRELALWRALTAARTERDTAIKTIESRADQDMKTEQAIRELQDNAAAGSERESALSKSLKESNDALQVFEDVQATTQKTIKAQAEAIAAHEQEASERIARIAALEQQIASHKCPEPQQHQKKR